MIDLLHISPTRWLGLLGFGLAALACLRTAQRRHSPWRALAAAHGTFFVEILFGLRQRVHDAADAFLIARNWYAQRESWQFGLLALLVLLTLVVTSRIMTNARGRGRAGTLALVATVVTAALFLLEVVSLHAIDSLLYARLGGVLSISIAWAMLGLIVTLCALVDRRG